MWFNSLGWGLALTDFSSFWGDLTAARIESHWIQAKCTSARSFPGAFLTLCKCVWGLHSWQHGRGHVKREEHWISPLLDFEMDTLLSCKPIDPNWVCTQGVTMPLAGGSTWTLFANERSFPNSSAIYNGRKRQLSYCMRVSIPVDGTGWGWRTPWLVNSFLRSGRKGVGGNSKGFGISWRRACILSLLLSALMCGLGEVIFWLCWASVLQSA